MKEIFAILLQEHKKFGWVIYPFLLEDQGNEYLRIIERLNDADTIANKRHFTSGQIQIIKLTKSYDDQSIFRRFTSRKIRVIDFINELEEEYVEKFIRPFIDRQISQCLTIAGEENIPVFPRETKKLVYKSSRITIQKEPARVVFNFIKEKSHTRYFQTLQHHGRTITLTGRKGQVISNHPCWILMDKVMYNFDQGVDGKKLEVFFQKPFIEVPEHLEEDYYRTFVRKCIINYPVNLQGIEIKEVSAVKNTELILETDLTGLPVVSVNFHYNETRILPGNRETKLVTFSGSASKPVFSVLYRDLIWEKSMIQSLEGMGLKQISPGQFSLEFKTTQYDQQKYELIGWFNQHYRDLRHNGFIIRQKLDNQLYYVGEVGMKMEVRESNDWFDIQAIAFFGDDIQIPIYHLSQHLISGIREYILPDGRVAILPEEWFTKYTDLVMFGMKNKNSLRIPRSRAVLVYDAFDEKIRDQLSSLETISRKFRIQKPQVPSSLQAELRAYQAEGVQWLEFLRKYRLGGCLADDMGLGKTLQAIVILLKLKEERSGNSVKCPEMNMSIQLSLFDENTEKSHDCPPSLVVMPTSLIHNWINEIRKFAPTLKYLSYTGPNREELLPYFTHYDIILTTYGTVRNDLELLERFHFNYIILDESQIIKNPTSKVARSIYRLKGNHRLALSGTPIENNLTDLWSQMNFLNRGLLGDLSFFKRYFATPIEKHNNEEKLKKLQDLVKPLILRRTKSEVEQELPDLTEDYIFCEMSPEQEKVYLEEKSAIRNFLFEHLGKTGVEQTAVMVLKALTRLRQIANHPALVFPQYHHGSGKFAEIVRNTEILISEGHKLLIFSSFVKHLELLGKWFEKNGILFSTLTGKTKDRSEVIRKFMNGEGGNVFLLSLKAGGVGLNLTNAGYVFLIEPWWNPAAEMQALSRAHRIGQSRHVLAYRFITLGTIEEKIMRLQQKKSKLSQMFIQTDNALKNLSVDEIMELME